MSSTKTYMGYMFHKRSSQTEIGRLAMSLFNDVTWDGTQHQTKLKTKGTEFEQAFNDSVNDYRLWTKAAKVLLDMPELPRFVFPKS